MAKRARDADRFQILAASVEEPLDAHHGIGSQQLHRRVRLLEADRPALDGLRENARQLAHVDLQADLERLFGRQAGAQSTELLAGERSVKLELPTPKRL